VEIIQRLTAQVRRGRYGAGGAAQVRRGR
jgi:hypothetical protein